MLKHPIIPVLVLLAGAAGAAAQCLPGWSAAGPSDPGEALDFAVYDADGAGPIRPLLVAAGLWGIRPADRYLVTRYDGRAWRQVGQAYGTQSHADSIGIASTTGIGSPTPGIYLGGGFFLAAGQPGVFLAHWDNSAWNGFPEIVGLVRSLVMFDEDGPGPKEPNLFVGGGIKDVAGLARPGLVRWDGTSFTLVGGSLHSSSSGGANVNASIIFDDDGPGPRPPALYVAGSFQTAGGLVVNNIARWDGQNWEALDFGLSSGVDALAVFDDDGDGPRLPMLYAAGRYRLPGGSHTNVSLSRWDGTQWSEMPGYGIAGVESLSVLDDDGDGPNAPALFVSGLFSRVGGVLSPGLAKWDGSRWLAVGRGIGGIQGAHANAMMAFDEDGDPNTPSGLYVGGSFFTAGGISSPGLARWGCPLTTCYADCEASTGLNVLDIFDFLCFQNAFVTNDPYACDCDTSTGNGVCDMLDFLCFQAAFVAGCP